MRYYFNITGSHPSADGIGDELPNDEAAWKEATTAAGEMFKDIDGKFRPDEEWSLEVTDDQRNPIYTIHITAKQKKV